MLAGELKNKLLKNFSYRNVHIDKRNLHLISKLYFDRNVISGSQLPRCLTLKRNIMSWKIFINIKNRL